MSRAFPRKQTLSLRADHRAREFQPREVDREYTTSRLKNQMGRGQLNDKQFVSMYRWHLPDPIAWQKQVRITIQQIAWKNGLAETQDDWSCATFWYEPVSSAKLPAMPDLKVRTADVWKD